MAWTTEPSNVKRLRVVDVMTLHAFISAARFAWLLWQQPAPCVVAGITAGIGSLALIWPELPIGNGMSRRPRQFSTVWTPEALAIWHMLIAVFPKPHKEMAIPATGFPSPH